MKTLIVTMMLALLLGCERRPTIAGLFGEEIGEKIRADVVQVDFGSAEVPEPYATMVRVIKPSVEFPIKSSDGFFSNYTAVTNSEGRIESLGFSSSVSKDSAFQEWMDKANEVRAEARKKYGESDYEDSDMGKGFESREEAWFIKGRILSITLGKMEDGKAHTLAVTAMTYGLSAKIMADGYVKDRNGYRKKWAKIKSKFPSDLVKAVETEIKAKMRDEKKSYL